VEPLNHNNKGAEEAAEEISLGRLLKKSREERNIEFEEAFRATRIRRQILEALENERWDELPSSTFVKGFLKTYADFLGLDKKTVLELYERNIPIERGKSEPLNQVSLGTKRWPLILILSLVALALIVSIIFLARKDISIVDTFYQYMGTQEPVAEQKPAPVPEEMEALDRLDEQEFPPESVAEEKQAPDMGEMESWDTLDEQEFPSVGMAKREEGQQSASATSEEEAEEEQEVLEERETAQEMDLTERGQLEQKKQEESVSPQFTLTAKVRKRTWIAIYVDDQPVKEYLFQPGETFTWNADQGFDILVGNAGGIDFILNDKEIGPLGAEGKVVRVKLPTSEE